MTEMRCLRSCSVCPWSVRTTAKCNRRTSEDKRTETPMPLPHVCVMCRESLTRCRNSRSARAMANTTPPHLGVLAAISYEPKTLYWCVSVIVYKSALVSCIPGAAALRPRRSSYGICAGPP